MAKPPKLLKYSGPQENLIVVEGADDFYALGHLCEIHKLISSFRLEEAGGYEILRDSIDTYLLDSAVRRIGFVVDADEHIQDRWASLRDILQSDLCGYSTVPLNPTIGGMVVDEASRPRLGLWIMPNNQNSGALEEFLRVLIPPSDPLWPYAVKCVDEMPTILDSSNENWRNKAKIHTWLAWRKESPGKPIGQAMEGRDFDPHSAEAIQFMEWVKRLFELDSAS